MGKFLTLEVLLANRPVKVGLTYGLNENVRLLSISNEERLKDGQLIPRNTYMTFAKYDDKGKVIAQSEFSYYNLDATRDNVIKDLATQINQLTSLANLYAPDVELDPFEGEEDMDIEAELRKPKVCRALIDALYKQFEKAVSKKIGDESPLLRMKVVVNKNNFVQLSNGDESFAELMTVPATETTLVMSAYDRGVRQKALTAAAAPKTADATSSAPAADLLSKI